MSEQLKPCPFCGGEARLDQRTTQSLWNSSDAVFSHVACDECDISGQDFCDDPNGEEASEWWNRRAQPAEAEGGIDLKPILEDVEREYEMGGLSDGLYADYASDVAKRYASAALSAVTAERDGLAAARMAYANEFAPDENGDPDVGNVHANIRALKAERDRLANAFGDCVNSLHAEMLQKYGGQLPEDMHPVTRRDYDRDMEEIAEYRAAMAAKEA